MKHAFTEERTFHNIDFTHYSLTKGEYEYCTFINCDFSNSDLADIIFIECVFEGCNLSLARLIMTAFRTSFNYSIDLEINRIKKAQFSLGGVTGLLDKYYIEIDINF